MSRTVGAGKKVQLSVKTSGIDDGEAAEIQVFKAKDDSTLDTLSSKVKNKVISAEWTAKGPEPEDEEQSWEVYYKAKCKGLETKAGKLVVYCDWVEVSSVDEQDAALPDAIFRITAGQESRVRNTGSSGVRKEEYLPNGPIKVEWLPPFKLIEWVDEKGPKRKAKVKKVPKAELVWPPKGAHTQWVNLPEDDAKPEQGSKVKLKVTLVGGKAGDKVYAKVEYGEDNSKRNDPKPEFVGGTTADWCPDGGIEGELAGDADQPDSEAVLELELGKAGGDVTVVSVGGDQECKDQTVTITNWRKLYYQVTRPAETKAPAFDVLNAAFDDVFIKAEQYGEALIAEGDLSPGALIEAAHLKLPGSGKRLVVGEHNVDSLKAKFQDDKNPLGAHLILCDAVYDDGEEQTIEVELKGSRQRVAIPDNARHDVFRTAIQNGQSALQGGSTWESMAPGGHADAGKRGDLTADDINWDCPDAPDVVQVVLPRDAAAIVGDGTGDKHKVKVTLKLLVAKGPFTGAAKEQHLVVRRAPSDVATNGVLVHELGHALKQALEEVAPGLSDADHGRAYTEHGHDGPHCAHGLDDAQFAEPDYFQAVPASAGKCVMWGAASPAPDKAINDGKFCARCRPFVLAHACDVVSASGGKQVVTGAEATAGDDGADATTPVTVTLELSQEATANGDPVPLGTITLEAPGATLDSTPASLGLSWKAAQGKLDPFKPAVLAHAAGIKITKVERYPSGQHLVRSRVGNGRYASTKTDPKLDRGGYMFAPADTADADLLPAWLWKNAQPKWEGTDKLLSIAVQLEGDKGDRKKEARLPVLLAKTVAPADRWGAVTLTLKAKLKLASGSDVREHDLPGPYWEQPKLRFLDDATAHSGGTLQEDLKKEYGNPKSSPPLHARDWVDSLTDASATGTTWRSAVSTAVSFINANLPAGSDVTITEHELATTFLTEGGYSTYKDAIKNGVADPSYSGYGNLGIDSYVTRWRGNSRGIKAYTPSTLTDMIKKNTNVEHVTNEAGDRLETFITLKTQDSCYAVGGLLAESKLAFAADLADATIAGKFVGKVAELPEHVQFFWVTLYYNTGTANGRSTLMNQGLHYHDVIWNMADDHFKYARFEKFNANWRTATFRLFKAAFPTWA